MAQILIYVGIGVAIACVVSSYSMDEYGELPESSCREMAELCKATPEGVAYRTAVLQQGRKFTVGEKRALESWNNDLLSRAACKELYGIDSLTN